MKPFAFLTLCGLVFSGALLPTPASARDPFWPIGWEPEGHRPRPTPTPTPVPEVEEVRPLTPEELRELEREQIRQIRENIRTRGLIRSGDRVSAYIQDDWRTVGDVISVTALGHTYLLRITRLSQDDIELQHYRPPAETPNPGTRQ